MASCASYPRVCPFSNPAASTALHPVSARSRTIRRSTRAATTIATCSARQYQPHSRRIQLLVQATAEPEPSPQQEQQQPVHPAQGPVVLGSELFWGFSELRRLVASSFSCSNFVQEFDGELDPEEDEEVSSCLALMPGPLCKAHSSARTPSLTFPTAGPWLLRRRHEPKL